MKWAVIGAGLAGLAVAYQLLERGLGEVILYESQGIGAGASGACAGLLHPYPGERSQLSEGGFEAIEETKRLLALSAAHLGAPVAQYSPLLRLAVKEGQADLFYQNSQNYPDVTYISACRDYGNRPALMIKNAAVVYTDLYLEGLFQACMKLGLKVCQERVFDPYALDCDHVFLCAGAGIFELIQKGVLPIKQVKGQALLCEGQISHAVIGKGHLCPTKEKGVMQIGSTYEHDITSADPDQKRAEEKLYPMLGSFYDNPERHRVIACRAGIRVSRQGSYLPLIAPLSSKVTALTAFGSRGLLYHATVARQAIENRLSYHPCVPVSSF